MVGKFEAKYGIDEGKFHTLLEEVERRIDMIILQSNYRDGNVIRIGNEQLGLVNRSVESQEGNLSFIVAKGIVEKYKVAWSISLVDPTCIKFS